MGLRDGVQHALDTNFPQPTFLKNNLKFFLTKG